MFTCSCYIHQNTPEIRIRLEALGWKKSVYYMDNKECLFINSGNGFYSTATLRDTKTLELYKDAVDCGDNKYLFLSLASLRDDSDMNQMFHVWIWNESMCERQYTKLLCKRDKFSDYKDETFRSWRKMTKDEIMKNYR